MEFLVVTNRLHKCLNYKNGDFPVSESLSETILSLPMHPYLMEEDIDLITNTIIERVLKIL